MAEAQPIPTPESPIATPKPVQQTSPMVAPKAQAPQQVEKRSYPTRTAPRVFSAQATAAVAAKAPAPAVSTAVEVTTIDNPDASAEPAPESLTEPQVNDGGNAEASSPSAEKQAEKPPAAVTEAEPKVDSTELAKRFARLHRAETKFAEKQRQFTQQQQQQAQLLSRAQLIEQGREAAMRDPIGFLARAFGVPPDHSMQLALDRAVGDKAKTPEQRNAEHTSTLERTMQETNAELARMRQERLAEQAANQQREYVAQSIAPIVAEEGYKFLRAKHGANASQTIYDIQMARFQKTGAAPSPKEVADYMEKTYREEAEQSAKLLGTSVTPPKAARPSGIEPPTEPKPGSKTTTPQTTAANVLRRKTGKPYVTKIVTG